MTLGFLDVGLPLVVIGYRIHAEADDFAVPLFEFGLESRHVPEFSRADGCEVLRMREEHAPGVANELVEADAALRGFGREIGRYVVNS